MSGPFVSDEQFEITVKYVETKSKGGLPAVLIIQNAEQEQRYAGNIFEIHTQWRQPTWKEANELNRQCSVFDHMAGERLFDFNTWRTLTLERFMKAWDVTVEGKEGAKIAVPCTPENINRLNPNIASALLDQFFEKTNPTPEQLGN